jgi:hypothetical protein
MAGVAGALLIAGEQAVNDFFVGVGRGIVEEGLLFLGSGRNAD